MNHTPTTDSKNSIEDWESRFDRDWDYLESGSDSTGNLVKDFIRRERELLAKEEYERGKDDALNIAHEIFGEVDDFWDLIDRYEAALETPS